MHFISILCGWYKQDSGGMKWAILEMYLEEKEKKTPKK
jgi:hypothetical protein